MSKKGDWLVASNKDGLWLMDTASSVKEMFLRCPKKTKRRADIRS